MKILRALLVLAFSSVAIAQGTAPPTSILGSVGITGGQSLQGQNSLAMSDANTTLGPNQYWAGTQYVTGTLTANRTITLPLNPGQQYNIINATTGGFSLILGGSSGTSVTVPAGTTLPIVCNGGGYSAATGATPPR